MRHFKVPLYSDSACTIFDRTLTILEIDGVTSDTITVPWISRLGSNFSFRIGKVGSRFEAPVVFDASSIYSYPNVNLDSLNRARTFFLSVLQKYVSTGASTHIASVNDGINLYQLFNDGDVLYIKNGARIECTTEMYGNNNPVKILKVYPRNGTTGYQIGSPVRYITLAGNLRDPSLGNYSDAESVASGNLRTTIQFAQYEYLFVVSNNHVLNSNYRDINIVGSTLTSYSLTSQTGPANDIAVMRTGQDSTGGGYQYSTSIVMSPYNLTGNLYRLFNYITNIDNYTEGEWIDVPDPQEDDDNTYPGGGQDGNTYPEDGESGKGDFDNTNDPIDFPTLPTFDVQSTGFISLWRPTIIQLTDLYSFLWDSDISTTLKKLFNEPMNAIFSLGIIPVDPVTQGTRRLTIGHVDTEIDMESIQKQFVSFDFGSIDINEYYGAAWDYSPYTQASIFLPYIGIQPVDIDDIMNCTLTLRYNIDVLTGTTIALLKCVRKGRDNLNAVMYEWQGNCVTQCPITAGNWSQIMASVIQLGAMTGLALSQPVAGAIGNSPAMYGSTAGTKLAASASEYADGKNLVSPSMATFGALNVLGSKVHVQRGGRIDMSAGAMSMQKAFVILNRPISGIPRGWNNYAGYPSLKIKTLGSQKGFVSVGAIKLDGLRATANEIGELDAILKAGVII